MNEMMRALGANPVELPYGQVLTGLATRLIDGAENNWPTYQNNGDYEAAKFYILDQHTRVPEILLASKAVKDSIDAADWAIVEECAKATQEFEIQKWAEKEAASRRSSAMPARPLSN